MPRALNDYLAHLEIRTGAHRTELIAELKKDFSRVINSPQELYHVLMALNLQERKELGNDCEDQLFRLISSFKIFNQISFLLPQKQKEKIFYHLKNQGKIPDAVSLNDHVTQLKSAPELYRKRLIERVTKDFSQLVKSPADLYQLLMALGLEERTEMSNHCEAQLLGIISSFKIFYDVSFLLPENQKEKIFYFLKSQGKIPEEASANNYIAQLKSAPQSYRKRLIEGVDFSHFIKSPADLYNLLLTLSTAERAEMSNHCEDQLLRIISSFNIFYDVSFLLPQKQKEKIFYSLKNQGKIPEAVSLNEYVTQLKSAPEIYRKILIERVIKDFSQLVKSPVDLYQLLMALGLKERTKLCNDCNDQLPALISNVQDLAGLSFLLPAKQKEKLLSLLNNNEPSNITPSSATLTGPEEPHRKEAKLPTSTSTPLFFPPVGPAQAKAVLDNPRSNLSLEQFTRIQEQIDQLKREINSYWPYPNKDRKAIKVEALEALIVYANTRPVSEAIQQIKLEFPDATKGNLSTRTADLLADLELEASLVACI